MDLILTGRFITAREALQFGLISRVVPPEHFFDEALKVAKTMAAKGPVALRLAKDAVLNSFETNLAEGLEYERKVFYMLFATDDQKEGMRAFMEKRRANFTGR
jgi:enoyl-CoA hydratase